MTSLNFKLTKLIKSHLYEIDVGLNKTVTLKFDQSHSFGLEFHNKCGYDNVQIFHGNVDSFSENNRIARFCGPKGSDKPFDGSRNLKPIKGQLYMWDKYYSTASSKVLITVDFDQGSYSPIDLIGF